MLKHQVLCYTICIPEEEEQGNYQQICHVWKHYNYTTVKLFIDQVKFPGSMREDQGEGPNFGNLFPRKKPFFMTPWVRRTQCKQTSWAILKILLHYSHLNRDIFYGVIKLFRWNSEHSCCIQLPCLALTTTYSKNECPWHNK